MNKEDIWKEINEKKRFVIKIGTNSLLEKDGKFDFVSIAKLVRGVRYLNSLGKEVMLVSSGAVSAGMRRMNLDQRPIDIVAQQVLSAIGNPLLMQQYNQMFEDLPIAQILLTQHDLSRRNTFTHIRNALDKILSMGIIPIINENDVISIDELVGTSDNQSKTEYNFSDNDVLSALTTAAMNADVLLILSDVSGLYTKHPNSPKAEFIDIVEEINENIKSMGKSGSKGGRGGMKTKLLAAEIASKAGAYVVITSAKKSLIEELIEGKCKCTIFLPDKKLSDKKMWLMYATNAEGTIFIDDGAKKALLSGASLLLPGIFKVEGDFVEKHVVELKDTEQRLIAKGISNYSSKVIKERLLQKKEGILPKITFEVVSHENMHII